MQRRWKATSAIAGLALALSTTGPVLAAEPQQDLTPQAAMSSVATDVVRTNQYDGDRYEGDSTGITTPHLADNIVEVGPSEGFSGEGVAGTGHASGTSNNTMGDIMEGLSNQQSNDEDSANGGSQPNSPNA